MAKFDEIEPLMQMGEYKPGNDALADEAVQKQNLIRDFLCQSTDDLWGFDRSVARWRRWRAERCAFVRCY